MNGVTFNHDSKWDIQLSQGFINEHRLVEVFRGQTLERIELKTESFWWRRRGNIAIEFRCNGKPSCLAVTKADIWVHELRTDDRSRTIGYFMFPVVRLKQLGRIAYKQGRVIHKGGDGGRASFVLIPIDDLLERIR
jgi:hypothetical protein